MAPSVQLPRAEPLVQTSASQARVQQWVQAQAQTPRRPRDVLQTVAQSRSAHIPWHEDFPANQGFARPAPVRAPAPLPPRPDLTSTDAEEFPIDARRAVTADPRLMQRTQTLRQYNSALSQVRDDINSAMTPMQRHFSRSLTVIGLLGSAGGAAIMGLYAVTALAGAASGMGAPVAALAVAAAVLTFLGGLVLTVLVSAMMRAIVRRSVQSVPGLDKKIETLQLMRRDLRDIQKRTPAEKALLRNLNVVLGKVEEANNNVASQTKVAFKTMATVLTGGLLAIIAGVEQLSSKQSYRPVSGGRELREDAPGAIRLPNGLMQMQALVRPMPS